MIFNLKLKFSVGKNIMFTPIKFNLVLDQ